MVRLEIAPEKLHTIRRVLVLRRADLCRIIHTEAQPFARVPTDELKLVTEALHAVNRAIEKTPRADRMLGKM